MKKITQHALRALGGRVEQILREFTFPELVGSRCKIPIATKTRKYSPRDRSPGGIIAGPLATHQGEPCSIPGGFAPGSPHVGIVPDDVADRRVLSETSFISGPCAPALLHTHFASPSLALKTSMLRAAQFTPEDKKSSGERSGELVGHGTGPPLPIHLRGYLAAAPRSLPSQYPIRGGIQGREKQQRSEKTRQPSVTSAMFPTCENPPAADSPNRASNPNPSCAAVCNDDVNMPLLYCTVSDDAMALLSVSEDVHMDGMDNSLSISGRSCRYCGLGNVMGPESYSPGTELQIPYSRSTPMWVKRDRVGAATERKHRLLVQPTEFAWNFVNSHGRAAQSLWAAGGSWFESQSSSSDVHPRTASGRLRWGVCDYSWARSPTPLHLSWYDICNGYIKNSFLESVPFYKHIVVFSGGLHCGNRTGRGLFYHDFCLFWPAASSVSRRSDRNAGPRMTVVTVE
ncbi:hypothetical protein PR048_011834 [Dryococelus australis]|uniref:Uncharacterized protein n=1 Tax=Dryococelus australis TaxID=614101 RepID=A0ABQ9HNF9_9NEOP|nr:hypothetical protein PR048_011834 [Dryococelus australis]